MPYSVVGFVNVQGDGQGVLVVGKARGDEVADVDDGVDRGVVLAKAELVGRDKS